MMNPLLHWQPGSWLGVHERVCSSVRAALNHVALLAPIGGVTPMPLSIPWAGCGPIYPAVISANPSRTRRKSQQLATIDDDGGGTLGCLAKPTDTELNAERRRSQLELAPPRAA